MNALGRFLATLLIVAAPGIVSAQDKLPTIAPTPPVTDNSNRIATTAWAYAFILNGLPLPNGKIWIGSAANLATPQTPSGDCTITIAGIITCTQASGNFRVFGNMVINGTTTATGAATFGGTVAIAGALTVNNTVNTTSGYYVNGVLQPFVTRLGAPWPLAQGGTGNALIPSAGGIVYSDAFGLQILPSLFANKMLLSGFAKAPPRWSAATWPDSIAASALLYSNGPSNVQGLATCNSGWITTSSTGVPSCQAFSSLTHKVAPAAADIIAIQDQAASGVQKYATLSEAVALSAVTSVGLVAGTATVSGTCTVTTTGTCPVVQQTAPATWTPADGSGAGLSLTSISAHTTQIGSMVWVGAQFSYPVTADATVAKVSGLPATVFNANYAKSTCSIISTAQTTTPVQVLFDPNAATFKFYTGNAATSLTNANLSGTLIIMGCWYPIS